MDKAHVQRIKSEMKSVGVTTYGFFKLESKLLPSIIHKDEHIGGIVYGQNKAGSVMLVATDKRVIYVDRKPFFKTIEELTYDVVSGVRVNRSGLFSSMVLHTRIADYSLRFVNAKCANIFTKYIESRRLEAGKFNQSTGRYEQGEIPKPQPEEQENTQIQNVEAVNFLKAHNLATLSSTDKNGNVHGAVVYYMVDDDLFVYVLTKSSTAKGRNIFAHPQVALTVHEVGTQQTLQLQGIASVDSNSNTKQKVFEYVVKLRVYRDKKLLPPITKIDAGSYLVIKISPTNMSYSDYAKSPE